MKKNVGKIDKIIRIVLSIAIFAIGGLYFKSWWALVGLVPLLTAAISFCPLYPVFGICTNNCKSAQTTENK